ncbi:MAG TPA: hypothetical protein EYG68_11500 [Leucothrix mucor]|nr:hypothetical protein [Leucothrix mucor]
MLRHFFLLSFIIILSACGGSGSGGSTPPPLTGSALQAANTVVQAIEGLQNGGGGLTPFTSLFDTDGVRFSPYYNIVPSYLVLTQDEYEGDFIVQNPPVKTWGIQDGSGDPIDLNVRAYLSQYVWDFPYHTAATVTEINASSDFLSQGNLINNMLTFYPTAQFQIVEYHQAGVDPSFAGMDWTSLMLVLKRMGNNQWSLVGLAHGSWTI